MEMILSLEEKKVVAVNHDRTAALKVIQPQLLYAVQFGKIEVCSSRYLMLQCYDPGFIIQAISGDAKSLLVRVVWHGTLVFSADLWPRRLLPLDGDLDVVTWHRGPKVSQWQTALFDRYPLVDKVYKRTSVDFAETLAFLRAIQHDQPEGYNGAKYIRPGPPRRSRPVQPA